jgi:ribosome-binding factor A
LRPRKLRGARRLSARAESFVFEQALDDSLDDPGRSRARQKPDRKALQLCGQVRRTLAVVLSGECGDPTLQDLVVDSVVPAPDSSRLLVSVCLPVAPTPEAVADVLRRLDRVQGWLRREVARAIVRKRAPELMFRVAGAAPSGKGVE